MYSHTCSICVYANECYYFSSFADRFLHRLCNDNNLNAKLPICVDVALPRINDLSTISRKNIRAPETHLRIIYTRSSEFSRIIFNISVHTQSIFTRRLSLKNLLAFRWEREREEKYSGELTFERFVENENTREVLAWRTYIHINSHQCNSESVFIPEHRIYCLCMSNIYLMWLWSVIHRCFSFD